MTNPLKLSAPCEKVLPNVGLTRPGAPPRETGWKRVEAGVVSPEHLQMKQPASQMREVFEAAVHRPAVPACHRCDGDDE